MSGTHKANIKVKKALCYEQTSPLAVLMYSIGIKFAHSASFFAYPNNLSKIALVPHKLRQNPHIGQKQTII